ncbi:3'(2'),5'-bisphosphate nucleotidase [Saccharobesus litoralis]|uniref:3'(2'),5'-bisphosphate nucleotidase CysQ n=1 Tax=Saccharobesus litoralis TaxID=2172099 RepID=A0A2S0VWV2_9ALTE|nr:3'(2'),5'-bisphosphate nucleotidase CysQ [Saccharobesus litoralis]AWB68665.1 3'(2'),5'-bisphosphate nucleotidase [Saccharobesus litoralis]
MQPEPSALLEPVKQIAREAGLAILDIYDSGNFELQQKDDESPVTSADYAANDILVAGLKALTPKIPIISEETTAVNLTQRQAWKRYWLLDPMDGTQEFVSRSGDFAVNIALVENGWPVMGVIYWPTKNTFYYAIEGQGAFKQKSAEPVPISVRNIDQDERNIKLAVSRVQKKDTVTRYLMDGYDYEMVPLGSASLKSCFIAEGKADCYLRIGPTGEWDTGASHCIIEEAGGRILDSEFNGLSYNKRDTFANPDFMVLGNQDIAWHDVIKPHKTTRKLTD